MSLLPYYLNGFPLTVSLVYLVSRFVTKNETRVNSTSTNLAWSWYINYSLANLFFVWVWDYAYSWRTGLLLISTSVILVCTMGQFSCCVWNLRRRKDFWWTLFCLWVFLTANIPITAITIWRKMSGLPLSS